MSDELAQEVAKTPKRGVGTVIREAILAGKDNEEALAASRAEFPESATTVSTVSWYRNQLRKEGKDVPTARDLKKAKAEAAAANAPATTSEEDPLG